MTLPEARRRSCAFSRCSYLDKIDYDDPASFCPNGHFGLHDAPKHGFAPPAALKRSSNPGDIFASIIFKITGQNAGGCGPCRDRIKQMNDWGWIECWRNRNTIVAWLVEEAARRKHKIDNSAAVTLLKAAFHELRNLQSTL